jgi:hypothetical protein
VFEVMAVNVNAELQSLDDYIERSIIYGFLASHASVKLCQTFSVFLEHPGTQSPLNFPIKNSVVFGQETERAKFVVYRDQSSDHGTLC